MKRLSKTFKSVGVDDLSAVARAALEMAGNGKVWVFYGEMGAGKTTFVKTICHLLGVVDNMSSPTFSIINEYVTASDERIFHFDFFRLKHEAEAYDIGTEDYFYSGSYCFIEWPEKIPALIPDEYIEIRISLESQTFRTIAVSVHDGKEKNGL
ncbi:MAG TPA: tRNA (adenosine(37)-N6)-threonylcarbamoyltransferase complex ATPase subunit type 1 TsaE [Chryseosolibacter sp.]|nr:tRNA (adenosine(37)-N6)-threonylcarbamoyltransferase complex ATPase subunit type 1 TsaE [Chryseosolibacter sp.]